MLKSIGGLFCQILLNFLWSDIYFMNKLRLCFLFLLFFFWHEYRRSDIGFSLVWYIRRYLAVCPDVGEIDHNHSVKVVSARLPHCIVIIFPFVISKRFVGSLLFAHNLSLINFTIHWWFSKPSILSVFIICQCIVRKCFSISPIHQYINVVDLWIFILFNESYIFL